MRHRMNYYGPAYQAPKRPRRRWKKWLIVLAVLLGGAYYLWWVSNPVLKPEYAEIPINQVTAANPNLPWPAYGQSAVGAQGHGLLANSPLEQKPVPIASVAKVMTALAVLKAHPLDLGDQGSNIPITKTDVDDFHNYTSQNGAVTKVVEGQKISEYQALQAMLIKSSNNMADTLARWAYGSIQSYTEFANHYAKELGMTSTHFVDANGFSPQTVSTAKDLVILGEAALDNPVVAEIVATWEADIPEAGKITNTNLFLDFQNNGVIGIKSGDTAEAGGTYLVAARYELASGQIVKVIGAVVGAPTHFAAQRDMMPLLQTTRDGFHPTTVIKSGQVIGQYSLPWGDAVEVVSAQDVSTLIWGSQLLRPDIKLDDLQAPVDQTATVGGIGATADSVKSPVALKQAIAAPPLKWRLQHSLLWFVD